MLNLIFKDIILSKRRFITVFITCFAIDLFYSKASMIMYVLIPLFTMYLFVDESSFYDYRYNVNVMVSSLPVRRRDVVISKYIEAIIFFIIGVVIAVIFTSLFKGRGYSVANVSSLNKLVGTKEAIESCALSCVLLISTYFPVYFKCQYMKVRGIFLLVNIVIVAMPIIFVKTIGSVNAYKFIAYLSKEPKWIITSITTIALVLILAVSLNLSIKFYENKDL